MMIRYRILADHDRTCNHRIIESEELFPLGSLSRYLLTKFILII